MIIPKDKGKRRRKERLKEKRCAFPATENKKCNKIFYGTARAIYCMEHRKRKYRNHIDKMRGKGIEAEKKSNNQIINHTITDNKQVYKLNCQVKGCGKEFIVELTPKIFIYPKYCEEHRNEYKRRRFLQLNEKTKV